MGLLHCNEIDKMKDPVDFSKEVFPIGGFDFSQEERAPCITRVKKLLLRTIACFIGVLPDGSNITPSDHLSE